MSDQIEKKSIKTAEEDIKSASEERDLRKLNCAKTLGLESKRKSPRMFVLLLVVMMLSVGLSSQIKQMAISLRNLLLDGQTLKREKCLIELGNSLRSHIQLYSDNCNFCKDTDKVAKLANLDPEVFEKHYAYSGVPLVVTDAMNNWTAPKTFNYIYFKELYAQSDLNADQCQFLPYTSGFTHMYDFLNMDESRAKLEEGAKPWYVGWNNCDEYATKSLRTQYTRPYFLPSTSESKASDWIFMGSPGYGAQMHVDNVQFPSWQAQLHGSKLWTLMPPPECRTRCRDLEVLVEAGEIIVLDTNKWFHKTKITGEAISITIGAEYD